MGKRKAKLIALNIVYEMLDDWLSYDASEEDSVGKEVEEQVEFIFNQIKNRAEKLAKDLSEGNGKRRFDSAPSDHAPREGM